MKTGKKIIVLTVLVFVFVPVFAHAVSWWPLVPCGTSVNPAPCNQCDLLRLLKNIIDFVLIGLMPPAAAILFVWGGFLILMGGANPGWITQGKSIFWNTAIGVAIISSSWLITNTIVRSLAADNIAPEWWKFECRVTTGGVPPPPVPPPPVPPSQSQAKAQELISAIGLGAFSTSADCGGNFHARQNIQDIAAGRFPAVCSPACSCVAGGTSGNITANASLLDGLTRLSQRGIRFTVSSLTTGRHSTNSSHYRGNGVDVIINHPSSVWIEARTFLNSLGGNAFCEDRNGRVDNDCSSIPSVVDHIHWTR